MIISTEKPLLLSAWSLGSQLIMQPSHNEEYTVWPAANLALYCPVVIEETCLIRKAWFIIGFVINGNLDLGLYSEEGTRLLSSGSTAMPAGSGVMKFFDVTDQTIPAGRYYMAMASDSNTAQFGVCGIANIPILGPMMGWARETSAFPLPATATFATMTDNYFPMFGFSLSSLVV